MLEDVCPMEDMFCCKCAFPDVMMHHGDSSYYPGISCFRIGRVLYPSVFIPGFALGKHGWHAIIRGSAHALRRHVWYKGMGYLNIHYRWRNNDQWVSFLVDPFLRGCVPTVYIRRIQRAIRAFLRVKWETRALCVAMGTHARLGSGSMLGGLDSDLLRCVVNHLLVG